MVFSVKLRVLCGLRGSRFGFPSHNSPTPQPPPKSAQAWLNPPRDRDPHRPLLRLAPPRMHPCKAGELSLHRHAFLSLFQGPAPTLRCLCRRRMAGRLSVDLHRWQLFSFFTTYLHILGLIYAPFRLCRPMYKQVFY